MSFMYTYLLTFIQQTNYHLISYRTIAQYTFFPHASNSNFLIVIIWGLLLVTSLSSRLLIRSLFKANFFFLLLRTSVPIPAKPQGWQPTLIIRINSSALLISSLRCQPPSKCRILLIFGREIAMTSLATRTERRSQLSKFSIHANEEVYNLQRVLTLAWNATSSLNLFSHAAWPFGSAHLKPIDSSWRCLFRVRLVLSPLSNFFFSIRCY